LFSKQGIKIKKNLTLLKAKEIKKRIESTGAMCRIIQQTTITEQKYSPAPVDKINKICPKCHYNMTFGYL